MRLFTDSVMLVNFCKTLIYNARPSQSIQKTWLRVCYDKNACKRAQEHGLTRPDAGVPSLLPQALAYTPDIHSTMVHIKISDLCKNL